MREKQEVNGRLNANMKQLDMILGVSKNQEYYGMEWSCYIVLPLGTLCSGKAMSLIVYGLKEMGLGISVISVHHSVQILNGYYCSFLFAKGGVDVDVDVENKDDDDDSDSDSDDH